MMQFHSKFSFLLLLCLMHICIEAKGTEHDEPLVTLDMKQTPIRKVLAEITRQTGVTFSYESSLTKHLLPIDITITAQPLSHCLRILFQKLPVEYIQSGKYIILKKKQKNIVISGFIRDKSSSESLIGASIYDAKSHQGTTSNADGFFSLTLEAGNDVYLNISYVGYDSFHRSFTQLEQDTLLPVLLNSHQQLAEVVVTGEYTSSPLVQTSDMGHTRLNKDLIQQTPVLFGEADIIKTLQTLPGVSAGTAGLAGMYVRGGNGDDNLYMIEGNPLYQINHVGGLFSSFNAEAVKLSLIHICYVNAGNVENKGFEFNIGWYEQFTDNFSWSTNLNFSYNDNKIKELVDDLPNGLTLTDFGGAKVILKEGGHYGEMCIRDSDRGIRHSYPVCTD